MPKPFKPSPIRGAAESADWAARRELDVSRSPHWNVEIEIPSDAPETSFQLNIYQEEWGLVFRRDSRVSSIRVTDVAFVHGLDEFGLLPGLPRLADIELLLRALEKRFAFTFHRDRATVRSSLDAAPAIISPWLVSGPH